MSKQLRAVQDHSSFQAELHVQGLRAELFDELHDPSEEMAFNDSERVFLSPQDRWPRRAVHADPLAQEPRHADPGGAPAARDPEPAAPLAESLPRRRGAATLPR